MHKSALPICWMMLALAAPPALADPVADCNQFADPQRQIKGCTSFIRRGGLDIDALASAYINRGIAHGSTGKIAAAIADFTEAIRLDPKNALAYYNRGNANFDLKKLDAAAADCAAAVGSDPAFALAFFNRGLVHERRGNRDAAVADYARALTLDPELSTAREKLEKLGVKPSVETASRPPAG